jgi:general secretion pathway protein F
MGVIGFVNQYIWVLLGIALVAVAGTTYYLKTEAGRMAWDRLLLKIPIIGDLIRKIEVSRFSRTMATLLKSGVPVLQSLQIVQTIITNRIIAQAMRKLREGLRGGQGFAKPLQKIGMFPPLAIHMIVVGEETGDIEDMLNQVADTFDQEVDIALKRVLNLIPIIIIIILGLGIGFMVVGVLVGMLSISSIIF